MVGGEVLGWVRGGGWAFIYVVRGGKVHVCADAGIPLVDCELVLGFGVV